MCSVYIIFLYSYEISTNPTTYSWVEAKVQNDEGDIFHCDVMPTPSAELSYSIYQYTGTTNNDFTKGEVYICKPWGDGSWRWTSYFGPVIAENTTQPVNGYTVSQALNGKADKVSTSSVISIAVSDWDVNTKTATKTPDFSDSGRTIVDIPFAELDDWNSFGVQLISASIESMGVSSDTAGSEWGGHVSYTYNMITSLTFKCKTIPNKTLTFKLATMEVA